MRRWAWLIGVVSLLLLASQARAEVRKPVWGPTSTGGSDHPTYVVNAAGGIAAVASTYEGRFTMVLFNATENGDTSLIGNMVAGVVKGLATDGSNLFVGGTQANATGNNTGILTLYDTQGNKNAHFPKTIDYGKGTYADGGVVDVACAGGVGTVTGTYSDGTHLGIKTVAYDTDGTQKILKVENSNTSDYIAAAVAADGSYVAVVGTAENATTKDILVFLYDYSNTKKWGKRYSTSYNTTAIDVALDSNHNVYVLSRVYNNTKNNWDTLILKYDSSGNLKWAKWFDAKSQTKDDFPVQIAIDSNGDVVVAGYYAYNHNDYFVAKFSPDGDEEWCKTAGTDAGSDKATAVAIDGKDNIIVTGYSKRNSLFQYYTLCFNATGSLVWSGITSAAADAYATSVAVVEDEGDVVVVVTGHVADYTYTLAYEGCGEKVVTNELPSGDDRTIEIDEPKEDPDPENHVYIGLGEVVKKPGTTMKIALEFPLYTDSSGNPLSVNIYVAFSLELNDVFYLAFLNSNGKFELFSEDNPLEPWKKNVKEDVDEVVIPPFSLTDPLFGAPMYPDTTYWFYTLVVPSSIKDDLSNLKEDTRFELTYFSIDLY